MPFWRCYYHVVWATKNRESLITPENEPIIISVIRNKSAQLECEVLAVNGGQDHVHVAVSIPPRLAVADWVGQVKGASSYEVNTRFPNTTPRFAWQSGYSVLTFGTKDLAFVVDYIANQKEHHASDKLEPYLERVDDPD